MCVMIGFILCVCIFSAFTESDCSNMWYMCHATDITSVLFIEYLTKKDLMLVTIGSFF